MRPVRVFRVSRRIRAAVCLACRGALRSSCEGERVGVTPPKASTGEWQVADVPKINARRAFVLLSGRTMDAHRKRWGRLPAANANPRPHAL